MLVSWILEREHSETTREKRVFCSTAITRWSVKIHTSKKKSAKTINAAIQNKCRNKTAENKISGYNTENLAGINTPPNKAPAIITSANKTNGAISKISVTGCRRYTAIIFSSSLNWTIKILIAKLKFLLPY